MKQHLLSALAAILSLTIIGLILSVAYTPAAAEEAAPADPMQFARGAQTWAATCARCHNMRDPKSLRDDQWRAAVAHMRVRAGLTAQEAEDVLTFLQQSN